MSSENYEYKFYQNFVITYDQFYDSANRNLKMGSFNYVNGNNLIELNTYELKTLLPLPKSS